MLGDNIEPVSDEVDEVVVAAEPKPKKKAKKVSTSTKN
jgi:hypothetical protein